MKLFCSPTSPYARLVHIALLEKGFEFELAMADPWADDSALRAVNPLTRVPALCLDDGTVLTESLLILQWLERQRPRPALFADGKGLERAGIAMGIVDAAVQTVIMRKVTAPAPFDDTPIGLRRRRAIVEGLRRLELLVSRDCAGEAAAGGLDAIASAVALDYLRLRFDDAPWVPAVPAIAAWLAVARQRPAYARTMPR